MGNDGLQLPCSSFPGTDLTPSSYLSVQSEPGSASPSSIVPVPSPDPQVVGIESSVSHAQLIWDDQAPGRFLVLGLEMKSNPSWISLDRDFEL